MANILSKISKPKYYIIQFTKLHNYNIDSFLAIYSFKILLSGIVSLYVIK